MLSKLHKEIILGIELLFFASTLDFLESRLFARIFSSKTSQEVGYHAV